MNDGFNEIMNNWASLAFKTGFSAGYSYMASFYEQCGKSINSAFLTPDELKRLSRDHVRTVEKVWERLLRRCAKDNEQTPSRKEFVAGDKLGTQI
jgi:hypothetical protein